MRHARLMGAEQGAGMASLLCVQLHITSLCHEETPDGMEPACSSPKRCSGETKHPVPFTAAL